MLRLKREFQPAEMNTPAHLIIGAAAFARPDAVRVNVAALIGALLPDFSLYFMVFWNRFVQGMTLDEIFGEQYFNPYWQGVFAIDNSIPIWAVALLIALVLRSPVLIAFAGAGLIHLLLDFPLHHDDGRAHFWPFSNWIFESPVSYWDTRHFGGIVGPLEGLLSLGLLVVLWRRFQSRFAKALILFGGLLECVPAILFPILFSFD